jgi:hypothetical protein
MSKAEAVTGYLRARSRNQQVGSGDTLMTVSTTSPTDVTISVVMGKDALGPGDEVQATVVDGPGGGDGIQVEDAYEDLEVPGYWVPLGSRVAVVQPAALPGKLAAGTAIKLRLVG